MRSLLGAVKGFNRRMVEDHMGAYAATCAYFLVLSFVPFILIFIAISRRADLDSTALMNAILQAVPSGLKSFVQTIINEVYRKPFSTLPISFIIVLWSASKAFHALTNGLNVISKVSETRGWFYTRVRSMVVVILLLGSLLGIMNIMVYWREVAGFLEEKVPQLATFVSYLYDFRALVGYGVLLVIFLCVYKFLPNCTYSFRSQLPGALVVTTVWTFFSYLMTVYYEHSASFLQTYGSLTGIILAMIWLYFCMYFVLVGAEMNRILYEDPDHNLIVDAIDGYMAQSHEKRDKLEAQIRMENAIASRRQALAATGDLPSKEEIKNEVSKGSPASVPKDASGSAINWASGPATKDASGPAINWASGPATKDASGSAINWAPGPATKDASGSAINWASGPAPNGSPTPAPNGTPGPAINWTSGPAPNGSPTPAPNGTSGPAQKEASSQAHESISSDAKTLMGADIPFEEDPSWYEGTTE